MVEITNPNTGEIHSYSMDRKLERELINVQRRIRKKDFDWLCCVDGEEGSGKSVLAFQLAKFIDPTFDLDNIYFTPRDFSDGIMKSDKYKAHVFDESFTGLSSRTSLSEVNHLLNSLIMEMRQRNLFVIIVLPTIFLLDKYISMFRARALFHVYLKRGRRGQFVIFNKQKKKILLLKGKKEYSYGVVKSGFYGRFYDRYTIDEGKYRRKKLAALKGRTRSTRSERYKQQRDAFINMLNKEAGFSAKTIAELGNTYDSDLKHSVISDILKKSGNVSENQPNSDNKL